MILLYNFSLKIENNTTISTLKKMNRPQEPLEWNIPPSAQSLEALYVAVRKQLKDLKDEVKEYIRRYKSF